MSSLSGKIIAVTKSSNSAAQAFNTLERLGAKVLYIPSIAISPVDNYSLFDAAVKDISSFSYLIFTSVNAVEYFIKRIEEAGLIIDYKLLTIACVGAKTSAFCTDKGIPVNIVPGNYNARDLIRVLAAENLKGKKILIPCSNIARDELKTELQNMGGIVYSIPVYKTTLPAGDETARIKEAFERRDIDLIAFTSPSSFNNILQVLNITEPQEFFKNISVAAIGDTTGNALKEEGIIPRLIAEESTLNGLADSIIKFYN